MEQKINVLIADQSDPIRNYLIGLLSIRYKELNFTSGASIRQALSHFQNHTIHITILDAKFLKPGIATDETDKLIKVFHSSLLLILQTKDINEKQSRWLAELFPEAIVLPKPVNPALLFHSIDNYLESRLSKCNTNCATIPTWAIHSNLNLEVLCQNYQNNREKVVKILKLYLAQIETQFQRIDQLLEEDNKQKINEEFLSLRTAFIYFAAKHVLVKIDQLKNSIEAAPDRKTLDNQFREAKKIWETVKGQLEEL